MPDVIEIAKERRRALARELAKLDEFIEMARTLIEWHQSRTGSAPDAHRATVEDSSESMARRTESAA